jgi:tetraacyldisaccharide 4'-kinase
MSQLWGWAVERRFARAKSYGCSLPVICVGNFTAGGTGKTPLSILIARELQMLGARPAFLTRGYRGRGGSPRRADLAIDTARDIGDEPLLLAREATVMVSADRTRGARLLEQDAGLTAPSVIIMDDGLQNPSLVKDLTIAVVDGRRGFGNGEVIPAGPLRAPLPFQLGLTDAVLVNRPPGVETAPDITEHLRQRFPGPVLEAWPEPEGDVAWLAGARVLAFAGIANPQRFFALVEQLGATIVRRAQFSDHHAFSEAEARRLLATASAEGLQLLTTEKDSVRLAGGTGSIGLLAATTRSLPIRLTMSERDRTRLLSLLEGVLSRR